MMTCFLNLNLPHTTNKLKLEKLKYKTNPAHDFKSYIMKMHNSNWHLKLLNSKLLFCASFVHMLKKYEKHLTMPFKVGSRNFQKWSFQIGSYALWRFVDNLDTGLENGDWEGLGRHGAEEQTEIVVNIFWFLGHLFHDRFQGNHPRRGQMTILDKFIKKH